MGDVTRQTRVVTFTANPSIDRTVVLDAELARGQVQRAASVIEQAAGKGVNVARVLHAAGVAVDVVAAVLDAPYRALADQAETVLDLMGVEGAGRVRVNTTFTEPDGTTTKVNEPGPTLGADEVAAASDLLVRAAEGAAWVVLSGSLPPGAPADWYARLVRAVASRGCKVAIDTSGAALDAVMAALPAGAFDLVKPNADELAQLTGGDAEAFERDAARGELDAIVAAAGRLRDQGVRNVLVTLGAAGAVLVNADGAWHATAPAITVRSTVGAGDSSVAGFIAADVAGAGSADALARAVAYGSAAASLPGTTLPTPADLPQQAPRVTALPAVQPLPPAAADR